MNLVHSYTRARTEWWMVEMIEDVAPPHSEVVTCRMEDGAMTVAPSAVCAAHRCAVWREPDLKWRPTLPTAASSGGGARPYNAATAGHSHGAAVRRRHYRLNDKGALYDEDDALYDVCVRRCAVSGATRRLCAATAGRCWVTDRRYSHWRPLPRTLPAASPSGGGHRKGSM